MGGWGGRPDTQATPVPHGPGYMGLTATMWVPTGAGVPILSPNDHPNRSQRRQKDFGKTQIFENFQLTHANQKTAKSSPP